MNRLDAALWAFPAAFCVHVSEEAASGFTAWACREASPSYGARDFRGNDALGFAMTVGATALVARRRTPAAVGP